MGRLWTEDQLDRLMALLEDDRPLYIFLDEKDQVLDAEWFKSIDEAMAHARTLDSDTVHICIHVGCAENKAEEFTIFDEYQE